MLTNLVKANPNSNAVPTAEATIYPTVTGNALVKESDLRSEAAKQVKRWQLEEGRTRKRVEEVASQLEASRLAKEPTETGEATEEDLLRDLRAEQDRTQELTTLLGVVTKKHDAAKAALRNAERLVQIETEVQAVEHLRAVAVKADALLDALQHLVRDEIRPAFDAVFNTRGSGCDQNDLVAAKMEFDRFVARAVSPWIPKSVAAVPMKYETWSQSLPDPDAARNRKR